MTAAIEPAPPRAGGGLPFVGPGPAFVRTPTTWLAERRRELGDTFLVETFGFRLLFLFSPVGLRSLYALPENVASFTEATRALLGFKLPPEILEGDMKMFHHLFGRSRMEGYVAHVEAATNEVIDALPPTGELELFAHMKSLVHRIGFRCWAGREATTPALLPRLVSLFETIDPEIAFLRPLSALETIAKKRTPEREALREIGVILADIRRERDRRGIVERDMLEELWTFARQEGASDVDAHAARNVVILHLASLSNLYAAMGWTLVDLLLRPPYLETARTGSDAFLDGCAMDSIRLAQRSITLRKVMTSTRIDDGARTWTVPPGVFLATMLSVTNTEPADLWRWDPTHHEKGKLAASIAVPTKEVVSTFGHGAHSCPGQRFALTAIRIVTRAHLARLEMTPRFERAYPKEEQLGAVARSAEPCVVRYERHRAPRTR